METQPATRILEAAAAGDRQAAEALLPLVYSELRRLASSQMEREPAGHTLQPTALVHEAYLRLIGPGTGQELKWDSRAHFFAAAATAMRHILVERARRRGRIRHGGQRARLDLSDDLAADPRALDGLDFDMLALDDALSRLEAHNPRVCQVVMLRFFAGLGVEETAQSLGLGPTTVKAEWNYARAWLHRQMRESEA